MKKIFFIYIFCFIFGNIYAQVDPTAQGFYQEALRFSETRFGGTARFQGLGGANTALGGDISSAFSNPAGLGFCRKSEISFTPTISNTYTNTSFLGEQTPSNRLNLNINQLGVLFAHDEGRDSEKAVLTQTFAITFSRINDFQRQFSYNGTNNDNSLIDYFMQRNDQKTPWAEFDNLGKNITTLDGLAYYTYLINPDFRDNVNFNSYFSFVPVAPAVQSETILRKGGQNQWNISYGANVKDRFYFGFSLGIQSLHYEQNKTYKETVVNKRLPMNNLLLNETLTQDATGANLSIGMIIKPFDWVNIGVNLVTPTLMRISDSYSADLTVNYNNYTFQDVVNGKPINRILNEQTSKTPIIRSDYTLISPFRLSTGLAFFIKKYGLITADLEMVNYSNASLSDANPFFSFSGDNKTIKNLYKAAINYRFGAEIRVNYVRLRGGFAYYSDPFSNPAANQDRSKKFVTAGIGFKGEHFYSDFTLITRFYDTNYKPYSLKDQSEPTAKTANTEINAVISLGYVW